MLHRAIAEFSTDSGFTERFTCRGFGYTCQINACRRSIEDRCINYDDLNESSLVHTTKQRVRDENCTFLFTVKLSDPLLAVIDTTTTLTIQLTDAATACDLSSLRNH
jgi:hypothetical protein